MNPSDREAAEEPPSRKVVHYTWKHLAVVVVLQWILRALAAQLKSISIDWAADISDLLAFAAPFGGYIWWLNAELERITPRWFRRVMLAMSAIALWSFGHIASTIIFAIVGLPR